MSDTIVKSHSERKELNTSALSGGIGGSSSNSSSSSSSSGGGSSSNLGQVPKLGRVQSLLKFGEQYKASQIKQFEDYYIDYDALKALLYELFATEAHEQEPLSEKRATFFSALIKEIGAADNFHAERLRKYYEQHLQVLLPKNYENWKNKQQRRRESFAKLMNQSNNTNNNNHDSGHDSNHNNNNNNNQNHTNTTNTDNTTKQATDTTTTTTTTTTPIKQNTDAMNNIEPNLRDSKVEPMAKDQSSSNNDPNNTSTTNITKKITPTRVSNAIRALSRLLIFWKQNELAITNSIKKYQAYTKEDIDRYLKIGTYNTSSFALPLHPKIKYAEFIGEKVAPLEPIEGDSFKDPKEAKKFKQDIQRLSRAIERHKKRKEVTEAEIAQLNALMHQLAQREPMPSSDVDLSTFFIEDPVATVKELPIDACEPGTITRLWLEVVDDPLTSMKVPVIICKGTSKGPVMGISAALHGNEVNGVSVIHRLLRAVNVEELTGVIVCIPCANPPGFIHRTRHFICGQETKDLNKCFPGRPDGEGASQFVYCLTHKFVKKITHLIDLHTASHGRQNSLYARADMNHAVCKQMAILQAPQIILHSTAPDGSLREAAVKLGKPAITVEIGNPSSFQRAYISHALQGIENVLSFLGMVHDTVEPPLVMPTICVKSKWSFAEHGGTLQMMVGVNQWLKKGDLIAIGRNIFGDMIKQYVSPEDGVVIGRNIDPTCEMGDRLIHFGTVGPSFPVYNNPFRDNPNAPSQQG